MLGDIKMHEAAALVRQHDEHEEHPAGDGWDGEEITGNQVLDMIGQERFPRWGRGFAHRWPILLHRRFGHVNAQFAEFADNARGAPSGIRLPHIVDQFAGLLREGQGAPACRAD